MSSTLIFFEDNGAAVGNPVKGTTRTTGILSCSLKNADSSDPDFGASPISAGNNSFNKYIFAYFSGTYNSISTVRWNHLSGVMGNGLSLFAFTGASGFYTTPAAATDARLIHNLTATGALSTGITVHVGTIGPEQSGKNASSTATGLYTSYIPLQMQTTVAVAGGNTTLYTFGLSYLES
jgi:hypothetical protein